MSELFYRSNCRTVITLDHVGMKYAAPSGNDEDTTVIQSLNLKVNEGEFLVMVGPSGCGKTTILSLMAGIIKPTSGHVYMYDKEVTGPD